MLQVVTFVLLACGATYIVTQSAIVAPIRQWIARGHQLAEVGIYCPACVGFWIGAALGAAGYWPAGAGLQGASEAAVAACGLGALWSYYGPESPWARERGDIDKEEGPNQ